MIKVPGYYELTIISIEYYYEFPVDYELLVISIKYYYDFPVDSELAVCFHRMMIYASSSHWTLIWHCPNIMYKATADSRLCDTEEWLG